MQAYFEQKMLRLHGIPEPAGCSAQTACLYSNENLDDSRQILLTEDLKLWI